MGGRRGSTTAKDTLRIALVSESFVAGRGGAEQIAVELSRALGARGHKLTPIAREPSLGRIAGQLALARRAAAARADHDVVVSLTRAPGDVLAPQGGVHLASIARGLGRRGPVGRVAGALGKAFSPKQWAFLLAERAHLRAAARIIAISWLVREDLMRWLGVDPTRIAVVPHGVDAERFRPPTAEERRAARAWLGVGPTDLAALFVSNNFELRGIDALIAAAGRLDKRWRVLVVGRGEAARYARLATKAGARVSFAGEVADVRPFYHAADVLALPTLYDPSSLVTLEALASGLPVVTTARNGAAELFTGKEAFVIDDPRDVPAIAAAPARLEDAPVRVRAGRAARETALRNPRSAEMERLCGMIEAEARARAEQRA